MAVNKITCGQGGSTGTEIVDRINELAKLDPRATLVLADASTLATQDITDNATKQLLLAYDTITTQQTGFVGDLTAQTVGNNTGHRFESVILTVGLNLEFSGELEFGAFIDGFQIGESHGLQGRGAGKPVALNWQADYYLDSGSVIDIRARVVGSGNITVTYKSAHLRIDASWRETMQEVTP